MLPKKKVDPIKLTIFVVILLATAKTGSTISYICFYGFTLYYVFLSERVEKSWNKFKEEQENNN
jgi:hypothetical protein